MLTFRQAMGLMMLMCLLLDESALSSLRGLTLWRLRVGSSSLCSLTPEVRLSHSAQMSLGNVGIHLEPIVIMLWSPLQSFPCLERKWSKSRQEEHMHTSSHRIKKSTHLALTTMVNSELETQCHQPSFLCECPTLLLSPLSKSSVEMRWACFRIQMGTFSRQDGTVMKLPETLMIRFTRWLK